mgnify:CR=1 FL=1
MRWVPALLIAFLPALVSPAPAGTAAADEGAPVCYGYAIIGYDMVVNARLGVPPDEVVGLAAGPAAHGGKVESYSVPVLKVVLGAYGWHAGPDDYATQVMDLCIQESEGKPFGFDDG